mgnify:FL=1
MDTEKVGKLIKQIRKDNHLTQKDLALKYNITYQAVSKWENGKNIPDISLLKQICDDFNIDINSLLTGDYTTNENKVSLKKDKRNLLKKKNFLFLCLFVLLIGVIMAIIILKNRSNDFEFKTISSDCSNFTITGSVAYNDIKSAIYIASINYCGGADDNLYKSIECILYEKNGTLENRISQIVIKEENPKKLEDLLKNVTFNIDNYIYKCKEFQNNGLYVTIKATDSNNKQVTYSVPLTMNNVCTDK